MAAKLEPIGVEMIAKGAGNFFKALRDAEQAVERFGKKVDSFAPATGKAVGGTQKLGGAISNLLPSLQGATGGLGGVVGALGPIAAVAGVAVGGLFLLKKGFDMVVGAIKATVSAIAGFMAEGMQLAGRFQEMEIAALAVGRSMGLQEKEIRGAIETYKDLGIRSDVAAKATASFAKNQIDLARASELVRVAQGAAIIMGEDSSATMERLTWAVTTQNTRMMRMMGIMVDFGAAQKRFAEANDRDAESLTQVEKNMIAVNEAIRAGASVAGIYEEAMKSPTKAMRSLIEREIPELKAAIGAPFLQAWATVINAVRDFVKALIGATQEGGALYPILVNLGAIASIMADGFSAALGVVTDFITGLQTDLGTGMADTVTEMLRWGVEIVAALAEGITQGAATVLVAAMNAIGNTLAFWLGAASAPKVAPSLVKWGVAAMSEYLHGFTLADFSVLEKIQAPLKRVLTGPQFAKISADMIKAISEGAVGEPLFERIAQAAGKFGTEIAELARLQFQLADATKAVEDAENRVSEGRQQVTDLTAEYNALVRAGAAPDVLKAKLAEINAAEEGLELAKEQRKEAKDQIGDLEDRAKLQEKVVGQLIGMAKAAVPPTVAGAAAAAARVPKARRAEAVRPEDILPSPAAFDISSRMSDAIDNAKAMIKERLAYIFEPLVTKWNETIKPTLLALGTMFREFGLKILEATAPIRDFFLPILQLVWGFVTGLLIPTLTELTKTTLAALIREVNIAKKTWRWLLGAIKELWSWVNEVFIPWVEEKFIAALEAIKEIVDKIKEAFDKVVAAVKAVITKLDELIQKFKDAADAARDFMGWSPSPLERGLRGAAAAMRQLSAVEVPRFSAAMTRVGGPVPVGAAAGAATHTATTSVTVPIGPVYIGGQMDMREFELKVEAAVRRAVGTRW